MRTSIYIFKQINQWNWACIEIHSIIRIAWRTALGWANRLSNKINWCSVLIDEWHLPQYHGNSWLSFHSIHWNLLRMVVEVYILGSSKKLFQLTIDVARGIWQFIGLWNILWTKITRCSYLSLGTWKHFCTTRSRLYKYCLAPSINPHTMPTSTVTSVRCPHYTTLRLLRQLPCDVTCL